MLHADIMRNREKRHDKAVDGMFCPTIGNFPCVIIWQ